MRWRNVAPAIATFRLSDAAQARALLQKNTSGTLTPEETVELDDLAVLKHTPGSVRGATGMKI